MAHFTYKDAGVDLEQYQQAMRKLPALMKSTHTPRVMDLPGGFAGLFRLNSPDQEPRKNYQDPVLVSGTDGVGTKLKVAIMAGAFETVGIDLVAMCVNDCLCLGAEPLFFLDYLALGKDDPELIAQLVTGISAGCRQAGAALLGGETAIMPDLYAPGDFDLAGFCVGVVERSNLLDGQAIQPGDAVLGLASSGFHSNGYSLIRKVVFEHAGLKIDQTVAELGQTVGEALLTPTRIYSAAMSDLLNRQETASSVHGMAHITGGGLAENIERVLPENRRAVLDRHSWPTPPLFSWVQQLGNIEQDEMYRVFNMGIGLALIVAGEAVDECRQSLSAQNIESWVVGEIQDGSREVRFAD